MDAWAGLCHPALKLVGAHKRRWEDKCARVVVEGSLLAEGELRLYVSLRGQPVRIPPMGKIRFARPGGSRTKRQKRRNGAFFAMISFPKSRFFHRLVAAAL
jgi:hypothetical protein